MRILAVILGLIILLLFGSYIIAFTDFGNGIVKPYVENIIKEKSGFNVKFDKFQIRPTTIDIATNINSEINAKVEGELSLFSQSLDLKYSVVVDNLVSLGVELKEKMLFSGTVKGKFSDFNANGAGNLLGSNLKFAANLKDYKPLALILDAKNIELDKALALANQPIYANGKIDITANIADEGGKPNGTANIDILNIKTNNALIAKDFNVTLPSNFSVNGAIKANIKDWLVNAKTAFVAPIAVAGSENTIYDINSQTLSSDFRVMIDDLTKFEPIINQKITGTLNIKGNTIVTKNQLKNFEADMNGFGGSVKAVLNNDKLTAKINSLRLEELIKVAAMPAFASAVISGDAILNDIKNTKNISGSIKLTASNGKLNPSEFKKLTNLDIASGVNFNLNANADVKNGEAKFDANFLSNLLNLKDLKGSYDIDKKALASKFSLNVEDLAKLESIVGQKLSGKVDINGDVSTINNQLKSLNIDGNALGGNIKANLKDEKLTANLNSLLLKDIFILIGSKPLANATINADVNLNGFDMKNLNGTAKVNIKDGLIYEAEMSKMLEKKLPAGLKFSANSDINLQKSVANFDVLANLLSSNNTNLIALKNTKGSFDINQNSLKSVFELDIPELKNISFLTDRVLYGPINLKGDAQKQGENITANVTSKLFNGDLKGNLQDNKLVINLTKFTAKGLTDMLGFANIYDGVGDMAADYNLATQSGKFNVLVDEGRLVKNNFTQTVATFTGRDITGEIYRNSKIYGTIDKNLIDFNADMNATRSQINVANGKFNTATKAMNIPVKMNYEKTDIAINITGTSDNPKYNISSDYIKGKALKELDRFLDKKLGGSKSDSNETNSTGGINKNDVIKDLIKGLF
ncbi:hypothetical protein [Campylobacter sp. RM16187]|uniref:hypothetical protein n=1 Tax=Campylobacter sp. RM16187 TaxID=1660063 RepID=UPI0021B604B4|nr:hypothetical protein [Campylobacter sp. RM16187]QKG29555.1 hypothetical protein CDOMF_1302 [Campylobacter sp. RM16187]